MATVVIRRVQILAWLAWDASGFFEWLARRPWYSQIQTDWLATIPIRQNDQVLEVGCGPGLLCKTLHERGARTTGLDRSGEMIKRARRNAPECTFVEGDALAIPLPEATLDLVCAASVVNIVPNPKKLVCEMARVVRPGGRVSALFPTEQMPNDTSKIAEQRNLHGLSAAALATWGSKAPKRSPNAIQSLFAAAGMPDTKVDYYWEGSIASITGQVNTMTSLPQNSTRSQKIERQTNEKH